MNDKKHRWDFPDELPDDLPLPNEVRERYRYTLRKLRTVHSDAEIRVLIRRHRKKRNSLYRQGLSPLDEHRPERKAPTTPIDKLLQVGSSTPVYELVAVLDDVLRITEEGIESYLGEKAVEQLRLETSRRQSKIARDASIKIRTENSILFRNAVRKKGRELIAELPHLKKLEIQLFAQLVHDDLTLSKEDATEEEVVKMKKKVAGALKGLKSEVSGKSPKKK